MKTSFYVYYHRRATDMQIFYVGKGCGGRYLSTRNRNSHWKNIVKKHGFTTEIVKNGMSEIDAFDLEKQLIESLGRLNLCNKTDGGEGCAGLTHSNEIRVKISEATKLALSKSDVKLKLSMSQTGRKHTEITKLKISESKKGFKHSDSTIENIRKSKIGRKVSTATKLKMSESKKGFKHSESSILKMKLKASSRSKETIQKQVFSNLGKKRTDLAKQNMKSAQKGKSVICSNGIIFEKMPLAVKWLKENGHPKASVSSISKACTASHRIAYGLKWQLN